MALPTLLQRLHTPLGRLNVPVGEIGVGERCQLRARLGRADGSGQVLDRLAPAVRDLGEERIARGEVRVEPAMGQPDKQGLSAPSN